MKYLIIILIVAVVVALLAARRSGPRITTIEHRRDETDATDDQKDGDA